MKNSHISNSTRTILSKASLMVECMICDVLDVFRTCLMSVSETWWPLLPTSLVISQLEPGMGDFYEDTEVTLLSLRTAISNLISFMLDLHICACCCLYDISDYISSKYSNFQNSHELGNIPRDGAWYSKINKQLVHHE